MSISGATLVAGVAGAPVTHSLSPLIHNAWLEAARVDGVYVAFPVRETGFAAFIQGLRGGVVRGLNVTVPFKEEALALATEPSARAVRAGAANVLVFEADGRIRADNTDGASVIAAVAAQVAGFDVAAGPVTIFGAGGAARGAVAALIEAGAPEVRVVNRTVARAEALAQDLGARVAAWTDARAAVAGARLIINATTLGLAGGVGPPAPLESALPEAVVMDMVYRPLRTGFLKRAETLSLRTVDGLEMLIAQARPSFEAFFGRPPPPTDVRALALKALGEGP